MQNRSQRSDTEPTGRSVPGRARQFLLLVTSMAISACLLGGMASSASALPENFFGFDAAGGQANEEQEMEAVARSGAKYWRFGLDCFGWYGHESTVWGDWDEKFRLAWEHGITALPTLSSHCTSVTGGLPLKAEWGPAGSPWENFAKAVVAHYGYAGSFWNGKSNPKPVGNWEIINEPNLGANGEDGYASGKKYAEFFQRVSETLHAAQGTFYTANALVGGMIYGNVDSSGEKTKTPHDFMQEMLTYSSVDSWISGVAIHPYEWGSEAVTRTEADISEARTDANKFGSNKTLWITEVGWPAEGHGDAEHPATTLASQEDAVRKLFDWVKQEQPGKNIQSLIFYMYRDFNWNGAWDSYCGLRSERQADWFSLVTFRPAWYAYQEETGAAKWPVAPGAETQAATNVGATQATLNGVVNPHGLTTGYHFEYGTVENSYNGWIPGSNTYIGWKEGNLSESQTLTGLEPNTTYHYRIVGTNENKEISGGGDRSFTTGQAPVQAHPLAETSGKLDLFWRNNEGELEYMSSNSEGSSWSTPLALGGAISGEPSAVETGEGHLAVFWRNATAGPTFGNLMVRTYNGSLGPIQNLGMGVLGSDPYAVGQSNGTIDVFWRGGDNHLWHAYYVGGTWSGAQNMGGTMASDPSPVQTSPGLIDVFWKGSDAALWHSWYTPETGFWHGPESRGMGPLGRGPKAVGQPNGTVDVFWKGTTGGLFHAYYTPGSWHGPENFNGSVEFDPAPVATGGGNVEVWYKGTNQELWHNWYLAGNGTWNGPGSLGSWPLGSAPEAAALASHNTFVFWTYPPLNGVYMKWYNASSGVWTGPVQVSTLH